MSVNRAIGVLPQAAENNKRLFRHYAKIISQQDGSNSDAYISFVLKLAAWLNNERAYYSEARPEIHRLLLLASLTLRRSLGISEDLGVPFSASAYPGNPMVHAYTTLIKSVEPFRHHFEERYRETLNSLMSTVSENANATRILSSEDQSVTGTVVASAHSRDGITTTDKGDAPKMDPGEGLSRHADQLMPEQAVAEIPSAIPLQTTENEASRSPSVRHDQPVAATLSSGKTRGKKRKNIDFNLLVQHDIKGLLEKKRSSNAKSGDIGPSDGAPISTQVTPFPDDTAITHVAESTETEKSDIKASGSLVDISSVSHEEGVDAISARLLDPQALESAADQLIAEPPKATVETEAKENSGVFDQISMTEPAGQVVPDPQAMEEDTEEARPGEESMRNGQEENTGYQNHLNEIISEQMDQSVTPSNATEPMPMAVDSAQSDLVLSSPTEAPVANVTKSDPNWLSGQTDSNQNGGFGTELRVVARQQGLKANSRISVQFEIPETQYQSVMNWINASHDVSSSLCITLGCYKTSDLMESATRAGCTTFEAQVSSTRCIWPQYGGLVMNANFNNSREEFPLSPPFQVTPESLVDVSPFLVIGNNVIELDQRQDLSQYTFVLHAHFPTQAQLRQLQIRQEKDKLWVDWLDHISRPFKIPLKSFDTSPQL